MARRIEFGGFDQVALQELRARQEGACAFSGEPLNETVVLHHVVPAGHGGIRTAETDAFVADWRRNGVLVNDEIELDAGRESGPHIHAHGGSFKAGATAGFAAFRHSHGRDHDAHRTWAEQGEQFVDERIYPVRERTAGDPSPEIEHDRER